MAISYVAVSVADEWVDSDVVAGHPGLAVYIVSNVYIDGDVQTRKHTHCRSRCG
jgi:hypothetical protein